MENQFKEKGYDVSNPKVSQTFQLQIEKMSSIFNNLTTSDAEEYIASLYDIENQCKEKGYDVSHPQVSQMIELQVEKIRRYKENSTFKLELAAKYSDIDVSKMGILNWFLLYHSPVNSIFKYSPLENKYKVLIPVSALMLDVLTETNYDQDYATENCILEGIERQRDVTVVVQIHTDETVKYAKSISAIDHTVYAIGFIGSHYERESAKYTLTEMMATEEDKFRNFPERSRQRFQNRHYSQKYFEDKIENLQRLVMIICYLVLKYI